MRVYQTNEIKNIALVGSAGSGKTTLAESMLFEAGVIKRRGSVEAKNTVSDYFPVEQEYGYSDFQRCSMLNGTIRSLTSLIVRVVMTSLEALLLRLTLLMRRYPLI